MNAMSRLSICALAVALAFAGFTVGGLEYNQLDATESARSSPDPEAPEIERSRDLDAKMSVVKEIVHRNQELAKELVAGSIDLQTAGRQFLEMDQHMPGRNPRIVRACYPNQSDLERCSRRLMDMALDEAIRTGQKEARLRTRLKSEFQKLVAQEKW
jgi:hypothetical protein